MNVLSELNIALAEWPEFLLGHLGKLFVTFLEKLLVSGDFLFGLLVFVPEGDELFEVPVFPHVIGRGLLIVEEFGVAHERFDFNETLASYFNEWGVIHEREETHDFRCQGQGKRVFVENKVELKIPAGNVISALHEIRSETNPPPRVRKCG